MIKKGNGFGIAGFVLGISSTILSFIFFIAAICAILGIIFSGVQMKRNSNGLAIAGLILSILGLIASISFGFLIISEISKTNYFSVDEINQTVVLITHNYEYIKDGKLYSTKSGGSGVMYYKSDGIIRVITNRHVTDCTGSENCGQITKQFMSVRTYDGKIYNVTKVYTSPNGLDLAILEINSDKDYPIAKISQTLDKTKKVVAIGYPGFSSNAREFSIGFGEITYTRNLITPEGYDFEAIDSNAYINFGSSGGGLFDDSGELIGITTWGDGEYSYAINIKHLGEITSYSSCKSNEYLSENQCLPLCEGIIDKNNQCALPCEDFYCKSEAIFGGDKNCVDESLILGNDGFCYKACGDKNTYCPNDFDYCFENKCTACPSGYLLYSDGRCYQP